MGKRHFYICGYWHDRVSTLLILNLFFADILMLIIGSLFCSKVDDFDRYVLSQTQKNSGLSTKTGTRIFNLPYSKLPKDQLINEVITIYCTDAY